MVGSFLIQFLSLSIKVLKKREQKSYSWKELTRGIILDALEKSDESVRMYKQSLEYEKFGENKAAIYSYLTMALTKSSQYEEACEYSKKLTERRNVNGEAYNITGWLYFLRGEFDKAKVHYDKAISLEPEDYLILMNQAVLLYLLGNKEETQGVLDKIKSLVMKRNQKEFKEEMKIYSDELKRLQKEGRNGEENTVKNCIEGIKFIMNFIQIEL